MSNAIKRTTSFNAAPRGLDIVSRLITLVMCFYIAVTPSLVFANTYTGAVNFFGFNNFKRTASGAVADFWFQNKNTAQVFGARAKVVTNAALGTVARSRILRLTPQALIVSFAVGEVISALTAKDWIVDQQNQRIYKSIGGWCVRPSTTDFPAGSTFCSDSPVTAVQRFIDVVNPAVREKAKRTNESGVVYYLEHLKYSAPSLFGTITASSTGAEVRLNYQVSSAGGYGSPTAYFPVFLDKVATSQINATDADVAAVLPSVSDAQIQDLVSTPDYAKEPHAPTLDAAAAAGVATAPVAGSECAGKSGTFNGSVFCVSDAPAGVRDNLSGETGSAAGTSTGEAANIGTRTKTDTKSTTNADGSVTDTTTTTTTNPDGTSVTQTTTKTTNPDGTTTTTTTGQKASEMPAFCAYAQTLCNWLDWTKQEPVNTANNKVTVAESTESDVLPNFDISQQRVVFTANCPASIPIHISMFGSSVNTSFSHQPLCEFMSNLRPFVIAAAYITGAYIIAGTGRGGGNDG